MTARAQAQMTLGSLTASWIALACSTAACKDDSSAAATSPEAGAFDSAGPSGLELDADVAPTRAPSLDGELPSDVGVDGAAPRDGLLQGGSASDGAVEAGARSAPPICRLRVDAARFISESSCSVPLSRPPASSPIYQSLAALDAGIVESFERCADNPLAWYTDDAAAPTKLIACAAACERSSRLFPGLVAAVKPLAGCDDFHFPGALCSLSEDKYQSIADISCVLPVARPDDDDVAYEAVNLRGARVVANHEACASDPLAFYPDDPTSPTQLFACEGACALSAALFPAFVAAVRPFLDCGDAPVRDQL